MSELTSKKAKYQTVLNKIIKTHETYIYGITKWDKNVIIKDYLNNIEKYMNAYRCGIAIACVCDYEYIEGTTLISNSDYMSIDFIGRKTKCTEGVFTLDEIGENTEIKTTFISVRSDVTSFVKYLEMYFKDTGFIVRSKYESKDKFSVEIECNLDNINVLSLPNK